MTIDVSLEHPWIKVSAKGLVSGLYFKVTPQDWHLDVDEPVKSFL